jgi:flagellar motility protein MotE (MotC chaperone)
MARPGVRRAYGGVGLIVICFVGSAVLRLAGSAPAIAEELAATAEEAPAGAAATPEQDPETLLAAIRAREAQLTAEAQRLEERAQTLNVAEAKLAEQLAAFETAQRQLEETLALADRAAEKDIERMTAVYESMDPDDAARIFAQMDVTFASGLLVRLRPETAAAILTGMEADAAYAITLTVASRNARVPKE